MHSASSGASTYQKPSMTVTGKGKNRLSVDKRPGVDANRKLGGNSLTAAACISELVCRGGTAEID